jgi:hypothetical protein
MKKIKKIVPHNCNKHFVGVAQVFQGFENHPLALADADRVKAKFGIIVQCSVCKTIACVPHEPQETLEVEAVPEGEQVAEKTDETKEGE